MTTTTQTRAKSNNTTRNTAIVAHQAGADQMPIRKTLNDGRNGYAIEVEGKKKFVDIAKYKNEREAYAVACKAMGVKVPVAAKTSATKDKVDKKNPSMAERLGAKEPAKKSADKTPSAKSLSASIMYAKGLNKATKNGVDTRFRVIVKDDKGSKINKSFSIRKRGADVAFIEAVSELLEIKGKVAFTVEKDELPVPYVTLLKKCGATKQQLHFAQ